MRLGLLLGMVYRMGTEGLLRAELGFIQTGRHRAYAAAERRETGKSTDLCSSLNLVRKSRLSRKLRLKVQVE